MVSAGQNYVFFGTGAFSYRIKYGVSAMFKICLDIFAFFRGVVSPLGKNISEIMAAARRRFSIIKYDNAILQGESAGRVIK